MRRRQLIGAGAALAALPIAATPAKGATARVVVIGGGFAGATFIRTLRRAEPSIAVTLVEPNPVYTACPMSNSVIAGLRDIRQQQFRRDALKAAGVAVVPLAAVGVDAVARSVTLSDGSRLAYDRLVLAPGIELRWDAWPGYDEAASLQLPHAWQAGDQTVLLRSQLHAMDDGGLVVIVVPAGPLRCPPGPYERASLIAHYLQEKKPRSKLVILDAKDAIPRQALFVEAWTKLYPGRIEWVPLSKGGEVVSVTAATRTIETDFDQYRAAVANVIPPHRAGRIAAIAGVSDRSGWCPVDSASFESRLQPGTHVIGDAVLTGALPKSASGAIAQARRCAAAVIAELAGRSVEAARLETACHSLAAPGYGIAIRGSFVPRDDAFAEVDAAANAPVPGEDAQRARDAEAAQVGFRAMTKEAFG
ncbi:MAG TPA: FAD-dependent oxidoreductase [Burkholderiaceae bacterium]|nr:FAD-dependent oxidoreductase [Burkholderiaceae bacterium]